MKRLNLTELENVNGCWPWESPFPKVVYGDNGMYQVHKTVESDFALTLDKNGKIAKISGSDANAFIRLHQAGVADKAKSNMVIM